MRRGRRLLTGGGSLAGAARDAAGRRSSATLRTTSSARPGARSRTTTRFRSPQTRHPGRDRAAARPGACGGRSPRGCDRVRHTPVVRGDARIAAGPRDAWQRMLELMIDGLAAGALPGHAAARAAAARRRHPPQRRRRSDLGARGPRCGGRCAMPRSRTSGSPVPTLSRASPAISGSYSQLSMADPRQPFVLRISEQREGAFVRQESRFRNWVTADGSSGFAPEAGPLPPVRRAGVPVGAPDDHRPSSDGPRAGDLDLLRRPDPRRARLGVRRTGPLRGSGQRLPLPGRGIPRQPIRTSRSGSRCRSCGTSERRRSSTTSRRTSCACSRPCSRRWPSTQSCSIPRHAEAIDALNDRIYEPVNNGVYKAGFSTRQGVYELAVAELFAVLDELDARLARAASCSAQSRSRPTGGCSRR